MVTGEARQQWPEEEAERSRVNHKLKAEHGNKMEGKVEGCCGTMVCSLPLVF